MCAENFIFYKKEGFERNIQAVIPRRNTLNEDRGVLITAWSVHKPKAGFFFLLQASVLVGHGCCHGWLRQTCLPFLMQQPVPIHPRLGCSLLLQANCPLPSP